MATKKQVKNIETVDIKFIDTHAVSPVSHAMLRDVIKNNRTMIIHFDDTGADVTVNAQTKPTALNGIIDRCRNFTQTGKRTKPVNGGRSGGTRVLKSTVTVLNDTVIKLQSTVNPDNSVTVDLKNNAIVPSSPSALTDFIGMISRATIDGWQSVLNRHATELDATGTPVFNGFVYGDFKTDKTDRDGAIKDIMSSIVKSGRPIDDQIKLMTGLQSGLVNGGTGKLNQLFDAMSKPVTVKTKKPVKVNA